MRGVDPGHELLSEVCATRLFAQRRGVAAIITSRHAPSIHARRSSSDPDPEASSSDAAFFDASADDFSTPKLFIAPVRPEASFQVPASPRNSKTLAPPPPLPPPLVRNRAPNSTSEPAEGAFVRGREFSFRTGPTFARRRLESTSDGSASSRDARRARRERFRGDDVNVGVPHDRLPWLPYLLPGQ